MQIKTTVRHPLILIRMAIIKQKHRQTKNKCWQRRGKIEISAHCWWEYQQYGCPSKKREKGKKKKKLLYDPVIPLLDIYPKELKSASQRDPLCIIELFTIVKRSNSSCSSVDEQICCIHTMGYYSAFKKGGDSDTSSRR